MFDPTKPMSSAPEPEHEHEAAGSSSGRKYGAVLESMLSTLAGITLFASAGIVYHFGYKWDVLRKMRRAFDAGYDPVLALASATGPHDADVPQHKVHRAEQAFIDSVVNGEVAGEYILLLGPKGAGKSTLLIDASLKNNGEGFAMCEGHEDPEVFRLRLGKALDFEFNEDSFAGLFQRRDPREAGPLLDIERALNKLEKVAIRYRKEMGRPLVLVFNNIHFVHDDEDGHAMLHLLQQRAEAWAQARVVTAVFATDDFHTYKNLKRTATRMHVISIKDLSPRETHTFLSASYPGLENSDARKIWDLVGGRLTFLGQLVKDQQALGVDDPNEAAKGMLDGARRLVSRERAWLEHKLGLIPDHDDDVMDEQKVSSCSFLLFQAFAQQAFEADAREKEYFAARPGLSVLDDAVNEIHHQGYLFGQARAIMTRPDYLLDLDHQNIVNVDRDFRVMPDSRVMLNVFKDICSEPDFQERLDNVRDRVDEIESLHRTAELTVKKANDLGGALRLRMVSAADDDDDDDEPQQRV